MTENTEDDRDILAVFHQDQREQIAFRRSRESEIFGWSAGLLFAFAGSMILGQDASKLPVIFSENVDGAFVLSIVVFTTIFPISWQQKEREHMAVHERVLARLSKALGAFEPGRFFEGDAVYPRGWESYGTRHILLRNRLQEHSKVLATLLIGLGAVLVTIAIYFPNVMHAISCMD